eukprot:TRINITY_DN3112_c0_g1_i2.p1 TRINITY_DN3112_c0_g1~~TRINITY_DN3112_c0_g1_i2.p1  ORF type:complete len:339 (-),score=45.30 TRINITY_DN3112_c0_g1_i2:101-1117(-)
MNQWHDRKRHPSASHSIWMWKKHKIPVFLNLIEKSDVPIFVLKEREYLEYFPDWLHTLSVITQLLPPTSCDRPLSFIKKRFLGDNFPDGPMNWHQSLQKRWKYQFRVQSLQSQMQSKSPWFSHIEVPWCNYREWQDQMQDETIPWLQMEVLHMGDAMVNFRHRHWELDLRFRDCFMQLVDVDELIFIIDPWHDSSYYSPHFDHANDYQFRSMSVFIHGEDVYTTPRHMRWGVFFNHAGKINIWGDLVHLIMENPPIWFGDSDGTQDLFQIKVHRKGTLKERPSDLNGGAQDEDRCYMMRDCEPVDPSKQNRTLPAPVNPPVANHIEPDLDQDILALFD